MEHTMMAPPWRDRLPSGELGAEYGPATLATYHRQWQRHLDWSWRVATPSKVARRDGAEMRALVASLDSLPAQERRAFELVYEQGHSLRSAARAMNVRKATVAAYLRRLRARKL